MTEAFLPFSPLTPALSPLRGEGVGGAFASFADGVAAAAQAIVRAASTAHPGGRWSTLSLRERAGLRRKETFASLSVADHPSHANAEMAFSRFGAIASVPREEPCIAVEPSLPPCLKTRYNKSTTAPGRTRHSASYRHRGGHHRQGERKRRRPQPAARRVARDDPQVHQKPNDERMPIRRRIVGAL